MSMNFLEIRNLVAQEIPWSSLFRKILAECMPGERERMVLFRELQQFFDVKIETLSLIGGWNYWPDGTYDDDVLNAKLKGKLTLVANPEGIVPGK